MADLFRIADEQRAAILGRERAVSVELVRVYGQTYQAILAQLRTLQAERDAVLAAGGSVNVGWLYQQGRLATLQAAVEQELARFSDAAWFSITGEQRSLLTLAREHVAAQLAAGSPPTAFGLTPSFVSLPTGAVEELVGVLANGSPLAKLLAELGPDAARIVGDGLVQGVATGQGIGEITRTIRAGLGGNLARAQRIARTEVLRSYRESSRQSMLANADVLKGWVWTASLSARTCGSCLAQHGSIHPLTERLAEHVAGRCVAIAIPRVGATAVAMTGPQWFDHQSDEVQHQVLGPAKFAAFKDGQFELADLVGRKHSHAWGNSTYERSLRDVLGDKAAADYQRAALKAA